MIGKRWVQDESLPRPFGRFAGGALSVSDPVNRHHRPPKRGMFHDLRQVKLALPRHGAVEEHERPRCVAFKHVEAPAVHANIARRVVAFFGGGAGVLASHDSSTKVPDCSATSRSSMNPITVGLSLATRGEGSRVNEPLTKVRGSRAPTGTRTLRMHTGAEA